MSSTSWWSASGKAPSCSIARPTSASGSRGKESRINEPATVRVAHVDERPPAPAALYWLALGRCAIGMEEFMIIDMVTHTHQTAPTRFVEAKGIRFAYRRFGKASGVPLVFNMHFTGTMDHWDPLVTDGFAKDREVILFDNAGVSSSSGEVPTSVEGMAANAVAFIRALGLSQVDVLGFSLGGLVAQELTLAAPELVRRLILVGTGPRSGDRMASLTPEAQKIFGAHYDEPDHLWLKVFFTPSALSQAAGRAYLKRFRTRVK